ncbi:membrane-bound dehydrogenase domain protein [Rhodopirellula maiorica SM1]|uniref:Membrane-bound dehydrogenase domain protein n=1 Tax=Rhodopirellula maiorica SM1 TaxID=1265738 RepID=M5RQU0_9BACT|nr:SGNH/GDSL hydrolase family protein [Rhodopirellula maiorica]EMI21708.1 membrane-bound dehydrogenase domain protein [Rhodopirellula maiorica SM1]
MNKGRKTVLNSMIRQIHCVVVSLLCGVAVSTACAESPIRPGDRIAIVGNTFADQLRIHGYLETMLLQQWPDNPVAIRNLGWGGDMLNARDRPTNFPNEEETLTAHRTDVIIACFGMGESFAGEDGVQSFQAAVDAFIKSLEGKQYNGKSQVRLILVSPIANEPLGKLTPRHEQRNSELSAYSQAMSEVAIAAEVPFIDLYQTSRYLIDERVGPNFTTNGIHLNPYGYWAVSHYLFRDLVQDDLASVQPPWRISVDAADLTVQAHGIDVSDTARTEAGLTFRATELIAPTLPPPTDEDVPPQLHHFRDSMTIANLPPGTYELAIDDVSVATANHDEWARGIIIDTSPAHQAAEALRRAVNDKNLQFTYSWKALNQVHIVGERKKSPSGRALPAEVIEFNRLAEKRDANLRDAIQRETRNWRVSRIEL